ncbi:hypothetical protein ABW20_dc0101641 [Dactylellina cionopaga]|nr:hypothetical protein ABW20_dc0101641 [Dactylellina cionopaga]
MFPLTSKYTLRHTLQKCGGDVDRAIDELLNLKFLDSEGERLKGIDGFSEDSMMQTKRRGKKKVKNLSPVGSVWEELEAANGTASLSKWEHMQSEVSYLSTRLNVPISVASSSYHKHGGLSATLVALIEAYGDGDVIPEDASHLETITSIMSKYPKLLQSESHVVGLVKMCKDDIASAFKFADILDRRQLHKISANSPPSEGRGVLPPISPTTTSADAWRVSDHLMGAVATYYAEEGKVHDTRVKAYSHMAAEALVNQNSSEYMLDLHGVTVQQALKITNERVTAWWVKTNSTDNKAITPFHIITGIGSHSKNGESRIGPAVSKMLIRGNWKIEIRTGNIRVLGVQKQVKKK